MSAYHFNVGFYIDIISYRKVVRETASNLEAFCRKIQAVLAQHSAQSLRKYLLPVLRRFKNGCIAEKMFAAVALDDLAADDMDPHEEDLVPAHQRLRKLPQGDYVDKMEEVQRANHYRVIAQLLINRICSMNGMWLDEQIPQAEMFSAASYKFNLCSDKRKNDIHQQMITKLTAIDGSLAGLSREQIFADGRFSRFREEELPKAFGYNNI